MYFTLLLTLNDDWHGNAATFLDMWPAPFVVSMGVVVETCGLLVGSRNHWSGGLNCLNWLSNPGDVSLVPQSSYLGRAHELIRALRVDCVDALLSRLGDDVSVQCFSDSHI